MNHQLSRIITENFMIHGDVVAAALANSVEPAMISHDLTTVQSVLDATASIPNVQWAFASAPDGKVLVHTFVPTFPAALKERKQSLANASQLTLPGETEAVVVFEKPGLTGIVGTVYVAFSRANLLASIRKMELIILLSVGAVMVAATMAFSLALKRTSGFLFHDVNGNSLSQTNLLRRGLRPALKKLGQPKAGFHAFRRFRTTWLRKNRTPEDLIRFWLGHADETVTDGYSKLRDDL